MRRISLAQLLAVIAGLALGLAALRAGTEAWFSGIFALTLVMFAIALLGALIRTVPRGGWWGFSLFGWGYFALAFFPAVRNTVGVHLPNTGFLDGVAVRCHRLPSAPPEAVALVNDGPGDFFGFTKLPPGSMFPGSPTQGDYYRAFHSAIEREHYAQGVCYLMGCWTAAALGALIGRVLGRRTEPTDAPAR